MTDYQPGDTVYYDDDRATVLERLPTTRTASDDYLIRYTDGTERTVWGSDLTTLKCPCTGQDGCPNPQACATPQGCHCGAY